MPDEQKSTEVELERTVTLAGDRVFFPGTVQADAPTAKALKGAHKQAEQAEAELERVEEEAAADAEETAHPKAVRKR